jgi:hypothetical protein
MTRREFEDPVEQVMFILGFKHDPRFITALEAMDAGSNPGITNALDQLTVYGAIDANFSGWRLTMKTIHEQFGSDVPLSIRDSVYEIIVEEMDEKHYGGKWFSTVGSRAEHWVDLGLYSPIFRRGGSEVFCLPAPYFKVLAEVFK